MNPVEFYLKRRAFKETYTIGDLFEEKAFFSNSLEDKVRKLVDLNRDGDFDEKGEGKVNGETAILAGRYEIVIDWSDRFQQFMPHILNVKGFAGIRIHWGSYAKDTKGCLLVGKNTVVGMVTSSKITYARLVKRLQRIFATGNRVFITIT